MLKPGDLVCIGCGRKPDEISGYSKETTGSELEPAVYVLHEEGTLNRENGHFLCDGCYIKWGQPVGDRGQRWVAP